jgi:predicted MFS family arabinose efflux permease
MALVLRPFAGRLADRHGRRPLLIGGGLLFAAVTTAHLLATHLAVLVALRLLLGVAEALFFVAAIAALADLTPPQRLGEAISYNSLALYLGIAAGPALGELLLDVGGFRLAWLGAAGLALVATLLAMRIGETRTPRSGEARHLPLIDRRMVAPGLAFLAGLAGAAGFLAFAALQARRVGLPGGALVLAVYGLVVIGCRIALAKASDRMPAVRLGVVALLLCAAGLTVTAALSNPPGLVTGAAILAIGISLLTPAFYRTIMSLVGRDQHGGAAGTFTLVVDLGLGGGPIVFGLVAAAASLDSAFAAGALIAALAATATALRGRPRRAGRRGRAMRGSRQV